jgi:hypothetical protein
LRSAGVGATVVGWEAVMAAAREYSWKANGELATPPVWMLGVS